MTQNAVIIKASVTQKLVQEQFDLLVFQAFNLNLVSFGQNAALNVLDVLSEKVYSKCSLAGKSSEVYSLMFFFPRPSRF